MNVRDAVHTKRAIRSFDGRPLAPAHLDQILDAGRRAHSSKNQQRWAFIVVEDRERLQALSTVGPFAGHIAGAAAAVALVTPDPYGPDAPLSILWDLGGAAAQMMLVAWELGVGSCPATVYEPDEARRDPRLPGRTCTASTCSRSATRPTRPPSPPPTRPAAGGRSTSSCTASAGRAELSPRAARRRSRGSRARRAIRRRGRARPARDRRRPATSPSRPLGRRRALGQVRLDRRLAARRRGRPARTAATCARARRSRPGRGPGRARRSRRCAPASAGRPRAASGRRPPRAGPPGARRTPATPGTRPRSWSRIRAWPSSARMRVRRSSSLAW